VVSNNFDAGIASQLLESSANRLALKNNILKILQAYNYTGVNIDIENVPSTNPTFTVSVTDTTNQNVTVTLEYSSDSSIKLYKTGSSGTWTDYSGPVIMSTSDTIYAKACDNAGNWSSESSYSVTNIRKTVLGYTVKTSSTDMSSYNSITANTSSLNEIATATYGVDGYGNLSWLILPSEWRYWPLMIAGTAPARLVFGMPRCPRMR
jgi:hypothetical protein